MMDTLRIYCISEIATDSENWALEFANVKS